MNRDFTAAIRRALAAQCTRDFLLLPQNPPPLNSRGMLGFERGTFKRLLSIMVLARSGVLPSANALGNEFYVCAKTIHRDLAFLRCEMGLRLRFDQGRRQYRCSFRESKQKKQSFSRSAKIRLIERELTISGLAKKLGNNRTNVSLVINQRRRLPKLEAEIRRELGLEELAA